MKKTAQIEIPIQPGKSGVINSADASKTLGFDARKTAAKLGSLAKRGWLQRVRRHPSNER